MVAFMIVLFLWILSGMAGFALGVFSLGPLFKNNMDTKVALTMLSGMAFTGPILVLITLIMLPWCPRFAERRKGKCGV